jgi:hypothetical protein
MSSTRILITHDLTGVDQSKPSELSSGSVYELLNLRPDGGEYVQTPLIGIFISLGGGGI